MASQSTDTTRALRAEIKERLRPIGVIRSDLKDCADAPKQGHEGAPDAWVDMDGLFVEGLAGITAGDEDTGRRHQAIASLSAVDLAF